MAFRVLALGLWPPPVVSSIVSCCQSPSPFPEKPAQAWVLKEGRETTSSFSEKNQVIVLFNLVAFLQQELSLRKALSLCVRWGLS